VVVVPFAGLATVTTGVVAYAVAVRSRADVTKENARGANRKYISPHVAGEIQVELDLAT